MLLDSLGDVARCEAAHGDWVSALVVDGNLVVDSLAGVKSAWIMSDRYELQTREHT